MDEERAQEDGKEQKLGDATVEADENGDSADKLGEDDGPGKKGRKAQRAEEALKAWDGEDRHLEIGMGDEHDAERRAQGEDAIGSKTLVDHGSLLGLWLFDARRMCRVL
jgi:hypothetical protein